MVFLSTAFQALHRLGIKKVLPQIHELSWEKIPVYSWQKLSQKQT